VSDKLEPVALRLSPQVYDRAYHLTNAVVFAVDEKSQIQALEHALFLPLDVGQPERRTHN
jgi:hypothetical protein